MDRLPSLLDNCTSGGCGAKISPGELSSILSGIVSISDGNLLVGAQTSDDAAVYRIDDRRSIISTVDFFPPVVADAKTFGKIAAANALSDVYAMGGSPLFALNLVCFPQTMDTGILREILAGGAEKCAEAGAAVAGGHSIYGTEIKYGLSVTGVADTDRIYRNNTPRSGDKLILTKPLGVGIIMLAERSGEADKTAVEEATASMERLNKYAAEKLAQFDIGACTDVTGFGLIVHALEMTAGNMSAEIYCDSLPYFSSAKAYAEDEWITGGGQRNRKFAGNRVDVSALPLWIQELMFDPKTSGGLLIAVNPEQADDLLRAIQQDDPRAMIIGGIKPRGSDEIVFI